MGRFMILPAVLAISKQTGDVLSPAFISGHKVLFPVGISCCLLQLSRWQASISPAVSVRSSITEKSTAWLPIGVSKWNGGLTMVHCSVRGNTVWKLKCWINSPSHFVHPQTEQWSVRYTKVSAQNCDAASGTEMPFCLTKQIAAAVLNIQTFKQIKSFNAIFAFVADRNVFIDAHSFLALKTATKPNHENTPSWAAVFTLAKPQHLVVYFALEKALLFSTVIYVHISQKRVLDEMADKQKAVPKKAFSASLGTAIYVFFIISKLRKVVI